MFSDYGFGKVASFEQKREHSGTGEKGASESAREAEPRDEREKERDESKSESVISGVRARVQSEA